MIDVHCHLDLYSNPIEVVRECERQGIYTVGVTNMPSHFIQGLPFVQNYKFVRLALGMHPLYATRHKNQWALFEKLVDKTTYIGEVGLDFSKEGVSSKAAQLASFRFVLNVIAGKNKIISLHSRSAEEEVLDQLQHHAIKRAIFHWYTGSISLIEKIVQEGFWFSLNPAMIRSAKGQAIIKMIPLTHILTESDGPFVQVLNKPANPASVELVCNYLAVLHQKTVAEIQTIIMNNFKRLLMDHSTASL